MVIHRRGPAPRCRTAALVLGFGRPCIDETPARIDSLCLDLFDLVLLARSVWQGAVAGGQHGSFRVFGRLAVRNVLLYSYGSGASTVDVCTTAHRSRR